MYISVAEQYVTSLRAQSIGFVLTIDFLMTGYTFTLNLLEIAFIVSIGTLSVLLKMILITRKLRTLMQRPVHQNIRYVRRLYHLS